MAWWEAPMNRVLPHKRGNFLFRLHFSKFSVSSCNILLGTYWHLICIPFLTLLLWYSTEVKQASITVYCNIQHQPTASNALLATCFMLLSCSAYFLTLKMEAICSSEKSVHFQWTTRRYIPEDRTLHNHCCENLKSYIFLFIFSP
jgi:hypothetical protein